MELVQVDTPEFVFDCDEDFGLVGLAQKIKGGDGGFSEDLAYRRDDFTPAQLEALASAVKGLTEFNHQIREILSPDSTPSSAPM